MIGKDPHVRIDMDAMHPNRPLNRLADYNLRRDKAIILDELDTFIEILGKVTRSTMYLYQTHIDDHLS